MYVRIIYYSGFFGVIDYKSSVMCQILKIQMADEIKLLKYSIEIHYSGVSGLDHESDIRFRINL